MNEVEVIIIFKRYSDKKKERVIKAPALLFSPAILSHLTHSWPGVNYVCKAKYKTLGNIQIYYNTFPLQRHLDF